MEWGDTTSWAAGFGRQMNSTRAIAPSTNREPWLHRGRSGGRLADQTQSVDQATEQIRPPNATAESSTDSTSSVACFGSVTLRTQIVPRHSAGIAMGSTPIIWPRRAPGAGHVAGPALLRCGV